jgi:uncharacterized protein (TIGR02145 family)
MKKSRNVLIYPFILIGLLFYLTNSCNTDDTKDSDPVIEDTKVTDIDGNVYHTVKIGSQVWMVENLKTTKYRNGDPIDYPIDEKAILNLTTGAYLNYKHSEIFVEKYGRLYNWYVVADTRGIAPKGWRVPDKNDFENLRNFAVVNIGLAGSVPKTLASQSDWENYSSGYVGDDLSKNNSTGFTGLPAGRYECGDSYGNFRDMRSRAYWWTTLSGGDYVGTERVKYAYSFGFTSSSPDVGFYSPKKIDFCSIRCIKE